MVDGFAARESSCCPRCGSQFASEVEDLGDNFPYAEMTIKAHLSCGAEGATEGATCLCGDTDGGACAALSVGWIEHEHRFDEFAISQFQQYFACAVVFGVLFAAHDHWSDSSFCCQATAQCLWQIAHC